MEDNTKRLIDLEVGSYFSTPLTKRWGRVVRIWKGAEGVGFCVAVELTKHFRSAEITPDPEILPAAVWEATQLHPKCLVIPRVG